MDSEGYATENFSSQLKQCILFICLFMIFTAKSGISAEIEEYLYVDTMWVYAINDPPYPQTNRWWKMNNERVTGPAFLTEITGQYACKGTISESYLDSIGIFDVINLTPSAMNTYRIEFSKNLEPERYFYYFKLLNNTGDFSNIHFIMPATLDILITNPYRWNRASLHQELVVIVKNRMYIYENSEWYGTEKWHKSRKINLHEMIAHYPASKRRELTLQLLQSVGATNALDLERMPIESWYHFTFPRGLDYPVYFSNFRILYGSGKFDRLLFDGSLPLDNSGAIPDSILKSGEVIPAAPAPPLMYNLRPAYPNPFNPNTTISFYLPAEARVTIAIYNVLGQRMATIINSVLAAGNHKYVWNAERFGSGIYFVRMTARDYTQTREITLLK